MSEPKTPRKYAHKRREYARSQAPQVSEPKTAVEFVAGADKYLEWTSEDECHWLLDVFAADIAARDKQIRQQERARVREVFLRMREEMRWLGVDKRCPVECWAREIGINLGDTDD